MRGERGVGWNSGVGSDVAAPLLQHKRTTTPKPHRVLYHYYLFLFTTTTTHRSLRILIILCAIALVKVGKKFAEGIIKRCFKNVGWYKTMRDIACDKKLFGCIHFVEHSSTYALVINWRYNPMVKSWGCIIHGGYRIHNILCMFHGQGAYNSAEQS